MKSLSSISFRALSRLKRFSSWIFCPGKKSQFGSRYLGDISNSKRSTCRPFRVKRKWILALSEVTISKVDDIKIKRIVSPPLYLAFQMPWEISIVILARFHGLKAAWKLSEIQLKLISRTKRAFFSSKGDNIKIKRIVSPFFLPLPLYLAFTPSLFLARFQKRPES